MVDSHVCTGSLYIDCVRG